MAVSLIPYGQLADGKFGTLLDNITGDPKAAAIEIFNTLPSLASSDNFPGRTVFEISTQKVFIFQDSPSPFWFPLEGIPAEVGNVAGSPPVVPVPSEGFLFWDRDTQILFVWDGAAWRAIGGRFAAQFVENTTVSTGLTGLNGDTFSLGPTGATPLTPELVEVFIDGVRQTSNPGGDYDISGTSVIFPTPVPAGAEVFTRTAIATVLSQNTQVLEIVETNTASGITNFPLTRAGFDPAGVFVYKNGLILLGNGTDYILSQADTTIFSIVKTSATNARATTVTAHNGAVGDVVEISGPNEPDFIGSFEITAIPTATTFDFTVNSTAPATVTTNTIIFYSPPFTNDVVVLTTPTQIGDTIFIKGLKNVVTAPQSGEANTASNIGTGVGLFSTKSGVELRFKTLDAGPNVTLTDVGAEIQISADIGTAFENRVGINSNSYTLGSDESYIGVRNTSFVVTIDLSTVPSGTAGTGRRIIIQDESGGAAATPIQIIHPGVSFSGQTSPISINTAFGSKYLVFDGSNWHIVAER